MKLENLELLYESMKAQGLIKTKFDFRFRNLSFSVIYIAEQFPHELLIGCRAHNLIFVVQVSKDFTVPTYLGDDYDALKRALGLRFDPANPFKPGVFFDALNQAIPLTTTAANTPSRGDIAAHCRDIEAPNKVYFLGWTNHDGVHSKPTPENLAKTKRFGTHAAYELCRRYHISSRWTDDATQGKNFFEPTRP